MDQFIKNFEWKSYPWNTNIHIIISYHHYYRQNSTDLLNYILKNDIIQKTTKNKNLFTHVRDTTNTLATHTQHQYKIYIRIHPFFSLFGPNKFCSFSLLLCDTILPKLLHTTLYSVYTWTWNNFFFRLFFCWNKKKTWMSILLLDFFFSSSSSSTFTDSRTNRHWLIYIGWTSFIRIFFWNNRSAIIIIIINNRRNFAISSIVYVCVCVGFRSSCISSVCVYYACLYL